MKKIILLIMVLFVASCSSLPSKILDACYKEIKEENFAYDGMEGSGSEFTIHDGKTIYKLNDYEIDSFKHKKKKEKYYHIVLLEYDVEVGKYRNGNSGSGGYKTKTYYVLEVTESGRLCYSDSIDVLSTEEEAQTEYKERVELFEKATKLKYLN